MGFRVFRLIGFRVLRFIEFYASGPRQILDMGKGTIGRHLRMMNQVGTNMNHEMEIVLYGGKSEIVPT